MRTTHSIRTILAAGSIAALAGLGLTACAGTDDAAEDDTTVTEEEVEPAEDDAYFGLIGAECEAVLDADEVTALGNEPVVQAISENPRLSTLTQAVSGELNPDVDLVDTLNGGEYTVFAPVDEAFDALDAATLETLQTDAAQLESILTYHVVDGELDPDQLEGEVETLQGETIEITGEGDDLQVNGAGVVCGGIETADSTVYLIDGVLTPTA